MASMTLDAIQSAQPPARPRVSMPSSASTTCSARKALATAIGTASPQNRTTRSVASAAPIVASSMMIHRPLQPASESAPRPHGGIASGQSPTSRASDQAASGAMPTASTVTTPPAVRYPSRRTRTPTSAKIAAYADATSRTPVGPSRSHRSTRNQPKAKTTSAAPIAYAIITPATG